MATLIRKTTTVVETVEMVVAAPVPMPRTVTAPPQAGPGPGQQARRPGQGPHRPLPRQLRRPGRGRLPLDLWKVAAVSVAKERLLIVGVRGTAAEGREAWVFFSEVTYLRG
jgi:hypothetical protein